MNITDLSILCKWENLKNRQRVCVCAIIFTQLYGNICVSVLQIIGLNVLCRI